MNNKKLKTYSSKINNYLEIIEKDHKKLLNTKNTNYSYGGLQDVLERGLSRIPMEEINSVLVLGMGGGCVVESLRNKFNYHGKIIGIELDPVVIEISKNEFGISEDLKVKIIQDKAEDYIQKTNHQFDLIIVDVFIDIKVPETIYSSTFWNNLEPRVSANGFVLFNAGIDLSEKQRRDFIEVIPNPFVYQKKLNVIISNTVFILQKVF